MTIEQKVAEEIIERSKKGKDKYGVTMDEAKLTRLEWLQHAAYSPAAPPVRRLNTGLGRPLIEP